MNLKVVNPKDASSIKINDINYIIDNLEKLDFDTIDLDVVDNIQLSNYKIITKYVDFNVPIVIINNKFEKTLSISSDYYYQNKEKIDFLLKHICLNKKCDKLNIKDSRLINDETLKSLSKNKNITKIKLGNSSFPYTLDKKTYLMFKKSGKKAVDTTLVSDELLYNFDNIISYNHKRALVRYYRYEDMDQTIRITCKLSKLEIFNLKYIRSNAVIKISNMFGFDNYEDIFNILVRIKELKLKNKIIVDVEDKKKFNQSLLKNINSIPNNTFLKVDHQEISIKDYLNYENRLYKLILPAFNLSPFEKYLYAYNVVKKFKKYKENKKDLDSSRNLYKILDNEYMVCVGFSKMLGDLLDKLGIDNIDYSVSVDVGYDKVPLNASVINDNVITKQAFHDRRIIRIVDPKYKIDGIYITDPTWDNKLDEDLYTYALMTQDEYLAIKRYSYYDRHSINELFIVNSLKEFYDKANYWMNERLKFNNVNVESQFIVLIILKLEQIDKKFAGKLKGKYPSIKNEKVQYTKDKLQNILYDIGSYIVSKVNDKIDFYKYHKALSVIYDTCYNDLNTLKTVDDILKLNGSVIMGKFPKRYKINKNAEATIYINTPNKFEFNKDNNHHPLK